MALTEDDTFNIEVLKLLLYVASIDGEVGKHESQMVQGLGRSWSVPEPILQKLLKEGDAHEEPNWTLLKSRSEEAIMAARTLVLADGVVNPEESMMLKKVKMSLA